MKDKIYKINDCYYIIENVYYWQYSPAQRNEWHDDHKQIKKVERRATKGVLVQYQPVHDELQNQLWREHRREEVVQMLEDLRRKQDEVLVSKGWDK